LLHAQPNSLIRAHLRGDHNATRNANHSDSEAVRGQLDLMCYPVRIAFLGAESAQGGLDRGAADVSKAMRNSASRIACHLRASGT
jgi:hypothetical protein